MFKRAGVWILWLATAARLDGQPLPAVPATVQLPTIGVFSVQTTVWVPDRGTAWLGGNRTAADMSRTAGALPIATRALASGRAASAASVHVTIIDHAAIDRALLARAADGSGHAAGADRSVVEQARWLTRHLGRADQPAQGPWSISEAATEHVQRQHAQDRQAADYLAAGERALAAGQPGAARVYFQMASRTGAESLREQARQRLADLVPTSSPGREKTR